MRPLQQVPHRLEVIDEGRARVLHHIVRVAQMRNDAQHDEARRLLVGQAHAVIRLIAGRCAHGTA
eukprot:9100644-Lingulodinium_polyedra.AAC.1